MSNSLEKYCTGCKQELATSLFSKNRCKPDGLSNICKSCSKEKFNNWKEKNKEKYEKTKNDYYHRNKEKICNTKRNLYLEKMSAREGQSLIVELKKKGCSICGGFNHLRVDRDHPEISILCTHCHAATRKHDEHELLLLMDFIRQQTFRRGFR